MRSHVAASVHDGDVSILEAQGLIRTQARVDQEEDVVMQGLAGFAPALGLGRLRPLARGLVELLVSSGENQAWCETLADLR